MKRRRSRNPVRSDFWTTPAGRGVQIAAGVGVVAGLYFIVKNWGTAAATSTELPVATETLLESFAVREPVVKAGA